MIGAPVVVADSEADRKAAAAPEAGVVAALVGVRGVALAEGQDTDCMKEPAEHEVHNRFVALAEQTQVEESHFVGDYQRQSIDPVIHHHHTNNRRFGR